MTTILSFEEQQSIDKAMEVISKLIDMSDEENYSYLDEIRTYLSVMVKEHGEGFVEGYAIGYAEGVARVSANIAKKMKADGFPFDIIQKYTSLTPEEINSL